MEARQQKHILCVVSLIKKKSFGKMVQSLGKMVQSLGKMVQMRAQKICFYVGLFYGQIWIIIPKLYL